MWSWERKLCIDGEASSPFVPQTSLMDGFSRLFV